jgi:Putative beta-barrel porin-2, OmpL-like. bbp2
MKHNASRKAAAWMAAATSLATPAIAHAQAPAAPAPAPAPAAPAQWQDTVTFGLQIEGGIILNPASPANGLNFGQLFTDRSNDFQLNQVLFTMQRPLDPKATGYDVGFKLQGMIGSDARYTRWADFGQGMGKSHIQGDIVEANILLHTPWLTAGGVDFKAGMYSTPIGAETIDPSTNSFYSHSYIFNFGIPLKHTGAYATWHATDMIDLYAGVDSGVNTTLGTGTGDNNGALSFFGGVGLNLMGGDLTVLALTHIGPENPSTGPGAVVGANQYNREIGDIVITWKANKKLTLITELNYIHDDNPNITTANGAPAKDASAGGIAQYIGYAMNDSVTLNARLEVFTDTKNFFVAAFPGNNSFNAVLSGYALTPAYSVPGNRGVTYGALTLGVTYKPALDRLKLPGTLLIRPEIRYDTSLDGTKPFNRNIATGAGKDTGAFTIGSDFVWTF